MLSMAELNRDKLNQLQQLLPEGLLANAAWLRKHEYASNLVAYYVARGWLESPARSVYRRPGPPLKWQHVVASLLLAGKLPLHIGGSTALEHAGFGHYARMRGAETIRLFGPVGLPAWTRALPVPEKFVARTDAMLEKLPTPRVWLDKQGRPIDEQGRPVNETTLGDSGLRISKWGESDWPLVYSTEERAILEMLQDVPEGESVYQANVMLQGMVNIRPARMSLLLRHCGSIKVKRLFLALAERRHHAWFAHLDLKGVGLGKGKRALHAGGKLHPKYQITLPADLDDHAR